MPVEISAMVIEDYDAVAALWRATEGVRLNESDTRERIAAYLDRNAGLSRVAKIAGQVVGAVLCGHDGRRGMLNHLAVARDCRGQGIGRRLVESCLEQLRATAVLKCTLFVFKDNQAGQRFWSELGWFERTEHKRHGRSQLPELRQWVGRVAEQRRPDAALVLHLARSVRNWKRQLLGAP